MELNIKNLFRKYENSSQRWILPIPVIEDGQLKLICYMNHSKDRTEQNFDAYYVYKINLLVLMNYLMETSNGQAYWKYVRSKQPRTKFLDLDDSQKETVITRKEIDFRMRQGHTKYILDLINKKFNEINYVFSIINLNEAEKQENELADMGYDY